MRTEKEIITKLDELFVVNKGKHSFEVNTLIWVLGLERDPVFWIKYQETYHTNHPGGEKPDFRVPTFLKWMGKGQKVLDCGVHTGMNTNEFAKENDVTGLDLPKVVEKYKKKYNFRSFGVDLNQRFNTADSYFDVVVAGEVIEHLNDPPSFMEEMSRLLKPKGKFIMSSPWKEEYIKDPAHCQYIDDKYLKLIFGKKFKIIEKIITNEHNEGVMLLAENIK